jgi:hypothetical protein
VYNHDAPHGKRARFIVANEEVCKEIFLLAYPVSPSTLDRMIHRVAHYESMSYDKTAMGGRMSESSTALQTAAWLLLWAEENGELLPGKEYVGKLYTPHSDVTELTRQMNEARKADGCQEVRA